MFDHFTLSTGYQPYVDITVGKMNHQWCDDKIGHGSPDAFDAGVMLAQQGSSTSSGPAQKAEESNLQVQGQFPSGSLDFGTGAGGNFRDTGQIAGSLGFGTGAGGNFRDIGQVVNGTLGNMSGQEFQGDEVVMEDKGMSGAHPMYERPTVVEGPYAAIKQRKDKESLTTTRPRTRKEPAGRNTKISKSVWSQPIAKRWKKSKRWVVKFLNTLTQG